MDLAEMSVNNGGELPMRTCKHSPCLRCLGIAALLLAASTCRAEEPVRLRESFRADYLYHVSCRVELSGTLSLPTEKGQAASRPLVVTGNSAIEYDERVLSAETDGQVPKTVRIYGRIDFQRKIGDRLQESTIRASVRRLVVLRQKNVEVPFSPDGPLTWNEIDLVRTDVFTPALAGLLPDKGVRPGDHWTASTAAIGELTDMERIDEGQVECRFEQFATLAGRRHAQVAFQGTVRGINEDGPNLQKLQGSFYFDLESNHLSYLSLKGASSLLDKDGKALGSVEGRFVLTRRANVRVPALGDEALRGVTLEPNDDNTLLLYDNPDMKVRFLYPRRWKIAGVHGQQIDLDEAKGSGLRLTVEPPQRVPTAAQFLAESQEWLYKQKTRIVRTEQPQRLQAAPKALDQFSLEIEVGRQRVLMDYYVANQQLGGVTMAARLLPGEQAALRKEVERIARSVTLSH
jgi:hypothetical protein